MSINVDNFMNCETKDLSQKMYLICYAIDKLLLLLLLNKGRQCKAERESDIHPISPKTPAPQYQPIDRENRKEKRVEDYSRDRAIEL